jgi:siroheme synthase-like protein
VQYYPVYLDVRGQRGVVIGGGPVAERKVLGLLEAGARVTVVSPDLTPGLSDLADTHEIVHHRRAYRPGDLDGAMLAVAATDDGAVHAEIAAEAAAARVLLNVVDRPALCTFIAPAVVERGPITIAISTAGASPALGARLRRELGGFVGAAWGTAAAVLGKLRPVVAAAHADVEARRRIFGALAEGPLLDAIREHDTPRVNAILTGAVGPGATLEALGVTLDPTSPLGDDGTPAS